MPVQSKLYDVLPAKYGYVVFTAAGSMVMNMWMMVRVMRARKTYNVELPDMYSKDSKEFNCIQRAHQNTLEMSPYFLMLLLVGGLQNPRLSAAAGCVYLLGRIAYTFGYSTGDPSKRHFGGFGNGGLIVLLGTTVSFACHQLGLVRCSCRH